MSNVATKEFLGLTAAGLGAGTAAGSQMPGNRQDKLLNMMLPAAGGAVGAGMLSRSVRDFISSKMFRLPGKGAFMVGAPLAALGIVTGMLTAKQIMAQKRQHDESNLASRLKAVELQKKAEVKEKIKQKLKKDKRPIIHDLEIPWKLHKGVKALDKGKLL